MIKSKKTKDVGKLYFRVQLFTYSGTGLGWGLGWGLGLNFTRSLKKFLLIDYPIIKGIILAFLLIIFPP